MQNNSTDQDKNTQQKKLNLSANQALVLGFVILAVMMIFAIPKIYLANSIYTLSRDVDSLHSRLALLKEENRVLSHKIELMKYSK